MKSRIGHILLYLGLALGFVSLGTALWIHNIGQIYGGIGLLILACGQLLLQSSRDAQPNKKRKLRFSSIVMSLISMVFAVISVVLSHR